MYVYVCMFIRVCVFFCCVCMEKSKNSCMMRIVKEVTFLRDGGIYRVSSEEAAFTNHSGTVKH